MDAIIANLDSPKSVWLIILFCLWAGLLFGGFVFGREHSDHTRRMPTWTRISASFVLAIAAWSWCLFIQPTNLGELAFTLALGMTLGFIGDLFMAQLIPIRNPVLGGIAAFGLGHLAYIFGLLSFGCQVAIDASSLRWIALIFWWAVGAIGWYFEVFRGRRPTTLHFAALIYSLLLASTVGVASGLALQMAAFVPLAVGAGLFLLSDLILAAQLFSNLHFRLISDVVWLAYSPGQMLIVFAIPLFVLRS